MSIRMFPVLGGGKRYGDDCPSMVPWAVLEPHEKTAFANHGQSLDQLASRGGLSPDEMVAIIKDLPYYDVWVAGLSAELKNRESVKMLQSAIADWENRILDAVFKPL